MATILVGAALLALLCCLARSVARNMKSGRCASGGCGGCGGCGCGCGDSGQAGQ